MHAISGEHIFGNGYITIQLNMQLNDVYFESLRERASCAGTAESQTDSQILY